MPDPTETELKLKDAIALLKAWLRLEWTNTPLQHNTRKFIEDVERRER